MTKDTALDLALEALEIAAGNGPHDYPKYSEALTAIKQALSAPVVQDEHQAFINSLPKDDGGKMFMQIDHWARESYKRHQSSVHGQMITAADSYESHVIWAALRWAKENTLPAAQPAPVQEPVNTLIAAWQALEETSGHVLDVGDVEGRMHMSVIRSAWEQMDSLVREMWDERGRP